MLKVKAVLSDLELGNRETKVALLGAIRESLGSIIATARAVDLE